MGAWLPSWLRIDAISVLLLLAPTLLSSTAAQSVTLLPSAGSDTFPACAVDCQTLEQAQGSCVPPAAPVTNQATYVSCFCQSALLTQLHSSPAGVCSACSAADSQKLQQWYNNFCSTGGNVQTTTTSASTTATNAAAAATTTGSHVKSYPSPPSWISTHYQWIIMIIILAIGLTAIALGGMWLKRRYDAKRPGLYHGDTSTAEGAVPPPDAEGVPGIPYAKAEAWGSPQTRSVDFANVDSTAALAGSKSEFSGTSTPDTQNGPNPNRTSRPSGRLQKVAGPSQEGDIGIHEV